ncbi:MAG: hypothetical protein P4L80_05555 [Xanthobacteraceae bacterium]|nr:hypothetical protein [Xanthobacteraceae bacterium]
MAILSAAGGSLERQGSGYAPLPKVGTAFFVLFRQFFPKTDAYATHLAKLGEGIVRRTPRNGDTYFSAYPERSDRSAIDGGELGSSLGLA